MTGFIISSTIKGEIALSFLFGTYGFSKVPISMFSSDGRLLHCTDKANVMQAVENPVWSKQPDTSCSDEESNPDVSAESSNDMILDDMEKLYANNHHISIQDLLFSPGFDFRFLASVENR